MIARRRAPVAAKIYAHIGGRSPIFEETRAQANALEQALSKDGVEAKAFVAMRYWHPFSNGAARAVKTFGPDKIVLLPLYPQYSTTTTASSLEDWARAARKAGLDAPTSRTCCYPWEAGFVATAAAKIWDAAKDLKPGLGYRLCSRRMACPSGSSRKAIPTSGRWSNQPPPSSRRSVCRIWTQLCVTRAGWGRWNGSALNRRRDNRAGREGRGVIVAPIAFVSEHSETLVELDIEYRKLAQEAGVPDYRRAATVGHIQIS
jgi:ferrochelatase